MNGPVTASLCDTLTLTNTLTNTGGVLSGLTVTNTLPSSSFSYVPGETVITLPGGVILTNAAADPTTNGQNLVWDFSGLTTPSQVSYVLLTEVYYNDSHSYNKEGYQWVELFNPTTNPMTLTGWKLKDAVPGRVRDLPAITMAAGEFVIVAGSTNCFFETHPGYTGQVYQVNDGLIGNGLNDYGDGVFLLNASSSVVDGMSYGNSTAAFSLPAQLVLAGRSIGRSPAANVDGNTSSDWATLVTPDPGTGELPTGLQGGDGLTIRYKVAGSCSAATGQFTTTASYRQPPSGAALTQGATASVTLNSGDLIISKTPLTQSAGRYDFVGWDITIRNVGIGSARNVVITDRLSTGFSLTNCSVTPASITATNTGAIITWDSSVIPALANLGPDATVTVSVTGLVSAVSDLSNKADVRWGCTTNSTCEDSVTAGETVTAGLTLIDRVPKLAGWITPATPVSIPYCSGTNLVLHITNGVGLTVGAAYSVAISNTLPPGWTLSGDAVDSNNVIQAGTIPAGGATNIEVTLVPGGSCPIFTNLQTAYFTFTYHDATDRSYGPPTLYTAVQVVESPAASVSMSVPASQTAATNGLIHAEVYFTYSHFTGSEVITFSDNFTDSANLSATNLSAGGAVSGGDVIWTHSGLTGSGVYTASFDLAIADGCAGPGDIQHILTATPFTNCLGCVTPVTGSGESSETRLYRQAGCPSGGGGGGGGCSYTSLKEAPTGLVEVCQTVWVTHSFINFTGTLPSWSNVTFSSDLGGITGDLSSTNDVLVTVNGSNVTAFCVISDIAGLQINLSGLTNNPFASLATATNLTITWGVQTLEPGRVAERSTLTIPACGSESATVYWNVGTSSMSVALDAVEYLEACGVTTGRISLAHLPSPGLQSGSNGVFAAYDVKVTLNLDADGNGDTKLTYENDSTTFSNMTLLGGTATNGFNPTVTSTQLVWTLGDLDPSGAGVITYVLRGACTRSVLEKQVARVDYNTRCAWGSAPQLSASAATNQVPTVAPAGNLVTDIQPQTTFLTDTQYVVRISFLNTGAGNAYNVTPTLVLPTNVVFQSASIAPSTITATSVVWTLPYASNPDDLLDADGDGNADDLRPVGRFEILVTNAVTGFSQTAVHATVSHGCNGSVCQSATSPTATFESNSGSLIARTLFAANAKLCQSNEVQVSLWNSGLIRDYDVRVSEVLPAGMTYVTGSSRYVQEGVTNNAGDPSGSGSSGDPLLWTPTQITPLAGLPPDGRMTILFSTLAACGASTSDCIYSTSATYRDIGQTLIPVAAVGAVQGLDTPHLTMGIAASSTVVDYNRTNIYTLTLDHAGGSTVPVPAMLLRDTLPTNVTFLGASVVPDHTSGQVLTWSNSTLMSLAGGSPYTPAMSAISITVTGLVLTCNYLDNNATVYYGCDTDSLCLSTPGTQRSISIPLVTIGDASVLSLMSWGGTRTVVVTNMGATARGIIVSNTAPTGFVFTASATVSGEFSGTPTVTLSGSPEGKVAVINFSSQASSGVTDGEDDAGDGLANLDLGNGKGAVVTFNLINDGSGMDTAASPLDWGYVDLEPTPPSQVAAPATVTYSNLCEEIQPQTVSQSASTIPTRPDPDVSLTPQSIVLTNGQVVDFAVSVINGADAGLTTNLHLRMSLGTGWTNLVCVSTQITQSATGNLQMEIRGTTNVLVDLPGFALDPVDDEVRLNFQATVVQGQGPLSILAEVAGESPVSPAAAYVGTNTLGATPLATTLTGSVIAAVGGAFYGFDQAQMSGAGFEVSKTVRYDDGTSPEVDQLSARVGEPVIFRIRANFFGASFSNVVLTESLEGNFDFGTPVNVSVGGTITNYTFDAGTGVFTLHPVSFDGSALATFMADIPATVLNTSANTNGTPVTNFVTPDFTVVGMTNAPPSATNLVTVIEPLLALDMVSDTNNVQAGDIVTFTNTVSHAGGSAASAYDIVFTDTLPEGMTFSGVSQVIDCTIDGATLSVSSAQLAVLADLSQVESVTIVVKAKVMNQLVGSVLSNVASLHYTSMPGANPNERTGSDGEGGLNDYVTWAGTGVTALPLTGIRKDEGASSQNNTTSPDLTIGERVVYTIRVDVPNGVSTNLQITDELPPGLDWVGSNSAVSLSYPGAGYLFTIPSNGPVFSTNAGAGLTLTDADPTPLSSSTPDGAGQPVRFTIATITNTPDGNAANDYFDLALECVVVDDAVNNVGIDPLQKSWSNTVTVADGFSTRTTNAPAYTIAEPDVKLRQIVTPVTGLDAGDLVSVTLIVTNTAAARANAYDVSLLDTLPVSWFDPATLAWDPPPENWTVTTNLNGANLEYRLASTAGTALPINTVITNRFTIRLAQTVSPNQTFSNSVSLQADTIDGTAPAGIPSRQTVAQTSQALVITNVSVAKTFSGTSETNAVDSAGQTVQIGETVTYALAVTLPEGTVSNLVVSDLMPRGMQYVTHRLATNAFAGTLGSPLGVIGGGSGAPVSLVFSNATVVTADNEANSNAFLVYLDAVVLNTNINSGLAGAQTLFTNRAAVTFAANPLAPVTNSPAILATNVEPRIWISTAFSTNRMDAGDGVTVTMVVSNTGLATAYDVAVTDTLNTLYFNTNTLTNFKVNGALPSGYLLSLSNATVWITSDPGSSAPANTLETNETVTFSFDISAAQSLPPNLTITNRVGLFADTMAGGAVIQRTVTGLVASATNQSPNIAITKTFSGTSETNAVDSAGQTVQIGETVTYALAVTLPEGTVSNLVVSDLMPRGMQYVTHRLATNGFAGTLGSPLGVIGGGSGAPVSLVFSNATVVTADNEANSNAFLVYLDAVVLNTNINSGLTGTQTLFTNRAAVTFAANPLAPVTNSPAILTTNIEPALAITKTFSTNWMDAGDVVTVTLVVTNSGRATAYDLFVTDAVSTAYFDTNNSVVTFMVNGQPPTGYTLRPIAGGLLIESEAASGSPTNTLEVNEGIVFSYQMTVVQTVPPNTSVSLAASFRADTMAATPTEQRSVAATDASASASIPNLSLSKSLSGTSLTHAWESAATNLQIGETATYQLDVTLPEGTVSNLVVTDLIPAGMRYVTYRLDTPSAMTLGTTQVTGGSGDGVPVALTFSGHTVVGNDNNPGNNTLGIEVDAVVLDAALNHGRAGQQTVFTNQASAAFSGPGTNTVSSSRIYTRAVEPSLRMIKTMTGPVNGLVTIDLVVTNEGLATAFDLVVTDRLDAIYFQTATLANTLLPDGFTCEAAGAPGDTTLTLASDANSLPPTNSIEPGESVAFRFTAQSVPNAGRSITNVATIVSNSTLSGASAWERVEPATSGTNILLLPMFQVTKTLTSPVGRPADVGETVTYRITVTNLGNLGMQTVLVSDTYPTNHIQYVSADRSPETQLAGGTLVWSNIGPVSVGGSTSVSVDFRARHHTLPGVMTNLVTAEAVTTNGASPASMSGSATNMIVPSYQLIKSVVFPAGRSAVTNGPALFTMTVSNSGDAALSSIRLDDAYDTNVLLFTSGQVAPDTATPGALVWNNLGSLAVGASVTVTGNFTALASTGSGKTTNTVFSSATFQGVAGLTTARTNLADLKIAIPVGLTVTFTNTLPPSSNVTFEITTVSGAVYHVISVSNNIDHPSQNWRHMVTWSNIPSWVSYKDSNVVQEVSNTRFYQIVWEEAGVAYTNPVMYEAFVQNLITGYWHELSMPVECHDYALNGTLGTKLAEGLNGHNVNGDLIYALKSDGNWQTYMLNASRQWIVRSVPGVPTADQISPASGYWVKRQIGGVSTNVEYVGPVRLATEAITFEPRKWRMISWPFPRSRREDYGTNPADKGWGFAAAGAHGDNNWELADRLYVGNGTNTVMLYLKPDGRWYKVGLGTPGPEVRLQHGVGYYYYHNGSGFTWTAQSPIPGTWY